MFLFKYNFELQNGVYRYQRPPSKPVLQMPLNPNSQQNKFAIVPIKQTLNCSKSTIETMEKGDIYGQ